MVDSETMLDFLLLSIFALIVSILKVDFVPSTGWTINETDLWNNW